jgi:hypothetical protein
VAEALGCSELEHTYGTTHNAKHQESTLKLASLCTLACLMTEVSAASCR